MARTVHTLPQYKTLIFELRKAGQGYKIVILHETAEARFAANAPELGFFECAEIAYNGAFICRNGDAITACRK